MNFRLPYQSVVTDHSDCMNKKNVHMWSGTNYMYVINTHMLLSQDEQSLKFLSESQHSVKVWKIEVLERTDSFKAI